MGGNRVFGLVAAAVIVSAACEKAEPPLEAIEVASAHRACEEGELCGVVETSCTSEGCGCGRWWVASSA